MVNEEKKDDYIHKWDEFRFYDNVKEAFRIFNQVFGAIIMITNQRGVAKGLTQVADMEEIHTNMMQEIRLAGGRIDKIYVCTDMEGENRKPNPGMGLQALNDFPQIDLKKSVMIGNTISDMEFGRNLGVAINIFLPTTRKEIDPNDARIDLVFENLYAVAINLPVR